jgi:predicted RNA-binding protein YlxR (DUF448 family)
MNSPRSSLTETEPRSGRERRCVACGESAPEGRLVRFARAPDGCLVVDVAAKLPGRGVWVCADRDSVTEAVRRGGFSRGLKQETKAPADLAAEVEAALARRCLERLGLVLRAGALALGASQVESAIRHRASPLLIEASDGGADGREKLMALHIGLWKHPPPALGCFTSSELGVALGRERVIHACVLQERLAMSLAAEISRLSGFRDVVPSSWPDSWRSVSWGPRLGEQGGAVDGTFPEATATGLGPLGGA